MASTIMDIPQRQRSLQPESSTLIRILLIEHHTLVRAGLRQLLETQPQFRVSGEAADPVDALAVAMQESPDIIVLDADFPEVSGVDVLPDLLSAVPNARVLVLTGACDPEVQRRYIRQGAMGLVRKEQTAEVLFQAIGKIHLGEAWFDRALMASILSEMTQGNGGPPAHPEAVKIATLTAREREVIALVGQAFKNQLIADQLCISEATVRHHLTSIFAKLGVVDRLELAIYAYRHGLARLPLEGHSTPRSRPSAASTLPTLRRSVRQPAHAHPHVA